jgi:hypothetical protein
MAAVRNAPPDRTVAASAMSMILRNGFLLAAGEALKDYGE